MNEQLGMFPSGLSREQYNRLIILTEQASDSTSEKLLADAREHLSLTLQEYEKNPIINLRLATAIVQVIEQVVAGWNTLPSNARHWLAGALHYFSHSDDDEPDFSSPIGFEDDVEVLNACLNFAGLNHLCLNVEDFDEV
jgi:uncharacterized membrane protein YkvA (DUF1232 family)